MLTVETGAIIAGAESYVTLAQATTYHSRRMNTAWEDAEDEDKEAALRKASAFLDGEYRKRWKGYRVDPVGQAMEWPRVGVQVPGGEYFSGTLLMPDTTIPQRLKDAQCELALRALSSDLAPDIEGMVQSEKVDVIETSYFDGFGPGRPEYRAVENLLSDLLRPKGSSDVVRG